MSARLILHVRDPDYVPSGIAQMERVLLEVGLIGKAWGEASEQRYLIGERFLQLVTFLGCSPAIELEPHAHSDAKFCHIGISALYPSPRFMADTQGVLPRCPHCRKRFEDWQSAIQLWRDNPAYQAQCPSCQTSLSPTELDWRQSAGFGRVFISIFNIYPREAIPTEAVLQTLGEATNQTWNYFYLREA
jgi:hypothetical protein